MRSTTSLLRLALLPLLAIITSTLAQESAQTLPSCAEECLLEVFGTGVCAPTNQTCICTDEQFQGAVTLCVASSCTIPDALAARNVSLTNCGAPVRDRSQQYIVLSNTMAAIAALFIVIRFSYKIFVARVDLGWDDWFVLASMIVATPSAIITVHGTVANGLGRDIWTLTPQQITDFGFYFYLMAWLYFTQVALVKLSLIFFYMRIFPSQGSRRLLWGTVAFTALFGFAFVVTAIFQCMPVNYFWTKWDGRGGGSCANANAISWANASINIALDLWILAIPLWQLRSLKLHWKKKIGVALMFCVGTFVTVVSILRLQSLVHFASTDNTTWEFFDVSIWSTIEICVGIMCACLPTIRLFLVKLFPVLGGSSNRTGAGRYYMYGNDDPQSKMTASRARTVGLATSDGQQAERDAHSRGIVFQKTYDVQYSDNDEASLVHELREIPVEGKPTAG